MLKTDQEISFISGVVDLPLLDQTSKALVNSFFQRVDPVGPTEGGHPVPLPLHRLAK